MTSIEIRFNGEVKAIPPQTVSELLMSLSLENKKIAIELNQEILPREHFKTRMLQAGDALEIVHFVGGG